MSGLTDKDARDIKETLNQFENIEDAVVTEELDDLRELSSKLNNGALLEANGKCAAAQRHVDPLKDIRAKVKSDGSTASYYELPEGARELQELISYKNLNAQMGEIFRAVYRYGQVEHSEKLRDAKKIKYYIEAEIARLEKYGD